MEQQVDIHQVLASLDDAQKNVVKLIKTEMKETAVKFTEAVRVKLPVESGAWRASIRPTSRVVSAQNASYSAGVRWRTVVYAGVEEFGGTIPNRGTHGKRGAPRHLHKPLSPKRDGHSEGYYVYPERDRQLDVLAENINNRVYIALVNSGFEVQKYTIG